MKKVADFFEKCILVIFILIYASVLLIDILFQNVDYYRKRDFILPIVGFALLAALFAIGGAWIYRRNKEQILKKLEKSDKSILIASILLFFLQCFICLHIYFMTGWDSGIITANADYVANGQTSELWNWYYSRCPNNSLLTAIYASIFWVLEHIGVPSTVVRLVVVFGQCAISVWTGYLMYRCARRMYPTTFAPVVIWGIYVCLLGLSPWLIIPYSDSSCLFMPMLILWLYMSMDEKAGKWKYLKVTLIGVISYLGYEIKPMVIIITIAILGVEILQNCKVKATLQQWSTLFVLCVSLFVTIGVCKVVNLEEIMGFEINEEAEFGLTHYLMMGFNYEHSGVYIQEDADYSESISTNAERKRENLRIAKERIEEYGVVGLAKHSIRKAMVNFNDGTFAWSQEGDFYGIPLSIPEDFFKSFLRNIYYEDGAYYVVFETVAEFFWMFTLLGTALNGINLWKRKKECMDKTNLVMMASLIGIAMFVMLFEARSRYLFVYVPIYIIMAVRGYASFYHWFCDRKTIGE